MSLEKTRFSSPEAVKCQHCGGNTIYHQAEGCDGEEIIKEKLISCISTHDYDDNWFVCKDCFAFHLQCSKCQGVGSRFPHEEIDPEAGARDQPSGAQLCRFIGFDGVYSNTMMMMEAWAIRVPPLDMLDRRYPNSPDVKDLQEDIEYRQSHPLPTYCSSYSFGYLDDVGISRFVEDYPTLNNRIPRYYVGDLNHFYAGEKLPDMNYQKILTGPDGGFVHQWKCPRCQRHYNITDK